MSNDLKRRSLLPAIPISPGVAVFGILPKLPCQRVPRPALAIKLPGTRHRLSELCLRSGRGSWNNGFTGFPPNNAPCRFFNDSEEIRAGAVGVAEHQFHCRVPKSALNKAQHRLENAGTRNDSVLGEISPFVLSLQKANDLLFVGFVMSDFRRAAHQSFLAIGGAISFQSTKTRNIDTKHEERQARTRNNERTVK